MIASRWRLPEAPRPSHASSRGTAAFSRVPALVPAIESTTPWSAGRARVLVQEYDAAGNELPGRYPVPISDPEIESVNPLILPDGDGGTFFAWNEQPTILILAVLARGFGLGKGEELYSPAADVEADGLVDLTDLAILAARFGDSP